MRYDVLFQAIIYINTLVPLQCLNQAGVKFLVLKKATPPPQKYNVTLSHKNPSIHVLKIRPSTQGKADVKTRDTPVLQRTNINLNLLPSPLDSRPVRYLGRDTNFFIRIFHSADSLILFPKRYCGRLRLRRLLDCFSPQRPIMWDLW